MRSTKWRGFSASISRVPVARPRTAQAARIPPSGPSTTLQPVARSRSVQCPTETPGTAVRLAGGGGGGRPREGKTTRGSPGWGGSPGRAPAPPPPPSAPPPPAGGAHDYLIKPVDLDELEMSLQSGLRQRQLEIDRRELEQWLAREVAVRTRDLEERTTVVEDVALAALAAAGDWPGASDAVEKLAKELGTSPEDVTREIRKRRGAAG